MDRVKVFFGGFWIEGVGDLVMYLLLQHEEKEIQYYLRDRNSSDFQP